MAKLQHLRKPRSLPIPASDPMSRPVRTSTAADRPVSIRGCRSTRIAVSTRCRAVVSGRRIGLSGCAVSSPGKSASKAPIDGAAGAGRRWEGRSTLAVFHDVLPIRVKLWRASARTAYSGECRTGQVEINRNSASKAQKHPCRLATALLPPWCARQARPNAIAARDNPLWGASA